MYTLLDIINDIGTLDKRSIVLLLLFLLLAILFVLYSVCNKRVRWRQKRNIQTASRVLEKIQNLSAPTAISYLRKIDPFVFEELLLTVFEQRGNRIIRNKRYTGDGGIDGRIIENGKIVLIQAKRYKSYVAKKHIADFLLLIQESEAQKGYFIHTGKTGSSTIKEFSGEKLVIISGQKLLDLLRGKK